MADFLWQRGKQDLRVRRDDGVEDPLVWEHCGRVARMAEKIASGPEMARYTISRQALYVACLYHDIGWVLQANAGTLPAKELFLKPTTDHQRTIAADWITNNLDGVMAPGVLSLAAQAVRHSSDRSTKILEAQILAEADNLDLIGPPTVCLMVRKQMAEGKALENLLSVWERQEEYRYWEARIKECFRLPSVRALAERRLKDLRRFMEDLRSCVQMNNFGHRRRPRPLRGPGKSVFHYGPKK
ncbi:MAG: HD domain-containing protein [Phycisphaerales bacterium]|nr:HD domain-containing protein [Phycisphaerales bacterium]